MYASKTVDSRIVFNLPIGTEGFPHYAVEDLEVVSTGQVDK
jgi:hypothetical protein